MDTNAATHVVDSLVEAELLDSSVRVRAVEVVSRSLGDTAGPVPESAAGPASSPASGVGPSGAGTRGLSTLVEVVAYLGGALVLAAGVLFLVQEWANLGIGTRVILLAVVALVLGAAGVLTDRLSSSVGGDRRRDLRRRLAGSLLTGAALAVAFLVGYVLDEILDPRWDEAYWPSIVGAAVGVLVAAAGYRLASSEVGVVGMLAGILTAVGGLVDELDLVGSSGDAHGVALVVVGALWLLATESRWFSQVTLARVLGVAVTLLGAQIPALDGTHAWLGYALTGLVAALGIAVYLARAAWPYLAVAVLAVTVVVPEAVSDWTDGSLGATGGVLVAGVTLLTASFAGYRLHAGSTEHAEPVASV